MFPCHPSPRACRLQALLSRIGKEDLVIPLGELGYSTVSELFAAVDSDTEVCVRSFANAWVGSPRAKDIFERESIVKSMSPHTRTETGNRLSQCQVGDGEDGFGVTVGGFERLAIQVKPCLILRVPRHARVHTCARTLA